MGSDALRRGPTGGTAVVVDTATNAFTATVTVGASLRQPVALPDGSAVYVPNSDAGTICIFYPRGAPASGGMGARSPRRGH